MQLYLPLEDCMALRKPHLPSYQGVNDCPRERFSNMGFWVADAKEKNISTSPSFGRTEIAATRCTERQRHSQQEINSKSLENVLIQT